MSLEKTLDLFNPHYNSTNCRKDPRYPSHPEMREPGWHIIGDTATLYVDGSEFINFYESRDQQNNSFPLVEVKFVDGDLQIKIFYGDEDSSQVGVHIPNEVIQKLLENI